MKFWVIVRQNWVYSLSLSLSLVFQCLLIIVWSEKTLVGTVRFLGNCSLELGFLSFTFLSFSCDLMSIAWIEKTLVGTVKFWVIVLQNWGFLICSFSEFPAIY